MGRSRALVLISDNDLLEEVLRLAAGVGCELERVPDPIAAQRSWSSAPLVVLDGVAARRCAHSGLARRPGVIVLNRGEPAEDLWPHAATVGAERVIALPDGEGCLVAALAHAATLACRRGGVLAVVGGRGGAGASVLAAAVAVAGVSDGEPVLLVDCDPLSGGLDLLLGVEHPQRPPGSEPIPPEVWEPAASPRAAPRGRQLGSGGGRPTVLSHERDGAAPFAGVVASVLEGFRRAGETVVCDLPRYPIAAAVAALDQADLTVLLVPAEVRSVAAAARVTGVLRGHASSPRLVVRGSSRSGLSAGDVAATLGLPLLHAMRPQPGLARALERGTLPASRRGPLAAAARAVLDELHALTGGASPGDVSV